jgi:hypothetical protein
MSLAKEPPSGDAEGGSRIPSSRSRRGIKRRPNSPC